MTHKFFYHWMGYDIGSTRSYCSWYTTKAACARVAHISQAKYIERILRDIEQIPVLVDDGSLDDILA